VPEEQRGHEQGQTDAGGRDAIDAASESLKAFLEAALVESDPASRIAGAEPAKSALLLVLDAAPDWDASLEQIGETLGRSFADRPSAWGRVGEHLELHFRLLFLADHPRAQRSTQRKTPDGQTLSPVRFELVRPFVRSVMVSATHEQRLEFYRGISTLDVWAAAAKGLADAAVMPAEVRLFLDALAATKFEPSGEIAEGLVAWTRRQPEGGMAFVEALVSTDFNDIQAQAIQIVVVTLTEDPVRESWRSQIVDQLFATRRRKAWNLVVALECFAAPLATSVTERHARMLSRVLRAPGTLMPAALRAIWGNAFDAPRESLATLQQLLELSELAISRPEEARELLSGASNVVATAVSALQTRKEDVRVVEPLLVPLLSLEPAGPRNGLDTVLAALMVDMRERTKRFLGDWLEVHADAIVSSHSTLADFLPLLAHGLGPNGEVEWLLGIMVASPPRARFAAASLLGASKGPIADTSLANMTELDARILLHEALGHRIMGVAIVDMLERLARRWKSLVPT
jgi:hypothetical protein